MSELLNKIDKNRLPRHVGVIMDGNGRWAETQGKPRVFGHNNAIEAVRETVEGCAEIGIECLSLYAFSTENWSRPVEEVGALMELLVNTIAGEMETLMKNSIRLRAVGDLQGLPSPTLQALEFGIEHTKDNDRMDLVLALNYSGKWDILNATRALANKVAMGQIKPENIQASDLSAHLSTSNLPDPELIIRTSNEHRLSNFFLWQAAYAEFYFSPVFWPEFRKPDLHRAILDFQGRERRFGKTSAQLGQPTNPDTISKPL
ncbi:di-trans,poly-cis-decaprenylcistransferase [Lewinellaceae bacterium SD302]|nr:di-trans,poly-cis-decaprenylcistransferase [Lewinellaceae bacterium SD302]